MIKIRLPKKFIRSFPYPRDFFCPQQYRGYYVRGQSMFFPYETQDAIPYDTSVSRYYLFQLVALILPKRYPQRFSAEDYRFGKLIGETKKDFETFRQNDLLRSLKGKEEADRIYPLPDVIDNDVMGITLSDCLKDQIDRQSDRILVSFAMHPAFVVKGGRQVPPPTPWIHGFLARYWESTNTLYSEQVQDWFSALHDTFTMDFGYRGMSKGEFFDQMKAMGDFASMVYWGEFGSREVKQLNQFYGAKDKTGDPLREFCYSFVYSMADHLSTKGTINRCPHCGDFFVVHQDKKYCSLKVEGKDCAKSARNKTYYAKNRKNIQERMRHDMQDLREYKKNLKQSALLKHPFVPAIQSTENNK